MGSKKLLRPLTSWSKSSKRGRLPCCVAAPLLSKVYQPKTNNTPTKQKNTPNRFIQAKPKKNINVKNKKKKRLFEHLRLFFWSLFQKTDGTTHSPPRCPGLILQAQTLQAGRWSGEGFVGRWILILLSGFYGFFKVFLWFCVFSWDFSRVFYGFVFFPRIFLGFFYGFVFFPRIFLGFFYGFWWTLLSL